MIKLPKKTRPQPRIVRGIRTCPAGAVLVPVATKRHATAKRWAERRNKSELVEAVAVLFQKLAESRAELQARYLIEVGSSARIRKAIAAENARAKLEKNPGAAAIQVAKGEARKFWQERREGKHPHLVTELQFASMVVHRWPELTSSDVVRQWAREWGKESAAEPKVRIVLDRARRSNSEFSRLPEVVATAVVEKWPKYDFEIVLRVAKRLALESGVIE